MTVVNTEHVIKESGRCVYLEVAGDKLLALHLSAESASVRGHRVVRFPLQGLLGSMTLAQLSQAGADAGYW